MSSLPDARLITAVRRDPWRPLRYVVRVPLLLAHLLVSLPITVLLINPLTMRWWVAGERADHRVIRAWSLVMMRIFGLRVVRFGTPLREASMLVANHVSWMDITLMHSARVVGFVAKSEISRWPVIGVLARRAGTIYHRRGSNESMAGVLHQMVERLQAGDSVGVFPEGGTTPGDGVRTFHARIFQAAVVADVPVQPVALRYGDHGSAQTVIAFAPGENFLQNFLRVLGEPSRNVEVHFLDPMRPGPEGRRHLAEGCRERILQAMDT